MHIRLDDQLLEVPPARTLAELLDGIAPLVDPTRLVTRVEVDGVAADGSDAAALARWRLAGGETIAVATEAPDEFVTTRRAAIPTHLERVGLLLGIAVHGLTHGEEVDANRVLAAATRELGLVLELDERLATLGATSARCAEVAAVVRRIGPRLAEAEQGRRWPEVARLLEAELLPAVNACAEMPTGA